MPFEFSKHKTSRSLGFIGSAILHLGCLAAFLWISRPLYVSPSSVALGTGGVSLTHIYWPGAPSAEGGDSKRKGQDKAMTQPAKRLAATRRSPKASQPVAQMRALEQQPSDPGSAERARSAGSPIGSLWAEMMAGHVIRPALPSRAYDPVVNVDDLHGREGDVVVEVTIDATGKVVAKAVLKSMGPEIDNRVLAALEGWEFLPATRDGVAIASKQDVYYHFPPQR